MTLFIKTALKERVNLQSSYSAISSEEIENFEAVEELTNLDEGLDKN